MNAARSVGIGWKRGKHVGKTTYVTLITVPVVTAITRHVPTELGYEMTWTATHALLTVRVHRVVVFENIQGSRDESESPE